MVKKDRGPTDPNVASLIMELRKASSSNKAPVWRSISKKLQKPRRSRPQVNVSKINRYTENNEFVIVPGKVLGSGELNHSVTVAALSFSEGAKTKILAAEGRILSISELISENPKGSGVRVLG
ncbi:MAG: 50S ribosomal protein L18e [Candidatus Kariarchaeaceae archaeon]|jgi:large subunit ribosomal protein L18e